MRLPLVLLAPLVGLTALAACGNSPGRVTVASKDQPNPPATVPVQESTTTVPPTTGTTAPAPTSTTTIAAPATTTTSRPATSTTTTTRPASTTTTRPAARTITITSKPNQYGTGTDVLVKGAGCAGPEYGVTLQIMDPSGQEVDGTGGLASPDGTWELPVSFGSFRPAGQYSFHATCSVTNGAKVFAYAPQTFNWAG